MTPDPAALDRSIAFDLVFNVRDLGGLLTQDDRQVRRGLVFRADGVNRLDGDDLEAARALGLRTVVDLRTLGEVEERGGFPVDRMPVDWHHLPVIGSMWSEVDLVPNGSAADFLRDRYLDMVREGGAAISRAVELAAAAPPMLFHCAAGKDRTGVVAATILGLLGVSYDDIAADYHLSAAAMTTFVDWLEATYPEAMDAMTAQPAEYLEAPPEAMLQFLDEVDRAYGGIEPMALELGVAPTTIDELRTTLLED